MSGRSPGDPGRGSAAVASVTVPTPALSLPVALAGRATVTVTPGCHTWTTVQEPPAGSIRDPRTGEPGLRPEVHRGGGTLIGHEHRNSTQLHEHRNFTQLHEHRNFTQLTWWDERLPPGG